MEKLLHRVLIWGHKETFMNDNRKYFFVLVKIEIHYLKHEYERYLNNIDFEQ